MDHGFDSGFDEEEERLRGRSRKRDLGAGAGADSDTMPGGCVRSSRRGTNGAGQEIRAGSGDGVRPRTPVFADRAPGRTAPDSHGQGPAAGSKSSAGPRSGVGSGQCPRYAGEGAAKRALGMSGKIGTRSAYAGERMSERPGYAGAGGNNDARSGYTSTGSASGERPVYVAGKSGDRPRFTGDRPDGRPGISRSRPGKRPRYTDEGKGARPAAGNLDADGTGGCIYSRSYAGAEDPGAVKVGDSSFGRNGGGTDGRRAAREAAAADSAAAAVKRRRKTIIVSIILEIIFLLGTGLYGYAQNKISLIRPSQFKPAQVTNPNIPQGKVEEMEGYWTIALSDVDSRNNSVGKGNSADATIICNADQGSGGVKLVSVFRDIYLSVGDNGLYNKINQVYFPGGPKQVMEILNRNLDLQIDDFAAFNWKAVVDAVNILGGVDVELSKAEFYYVNTYITETVEATGVGSYRLKQTGLNHLDGVQAVAYARLRKMDTDFARAERQREIIDLCFRKLEKSDLTVVNNAMKTVFPQIPPSVTADDTIPTAKNLTKYTIANTMGFPAVKSGANMGKKEACVIPQTLESDVILLHQFLFGDENYQPSDMIKKISAKISTDTGMYSEGRPIDHVGTDGGHIPKPTQATEATEETKENESESSTSETDESIIDDEMDLEIETDEFGNKVDPPEDDSGVFGRPGESSGSGIVHPGRPGKSSSDSMFPGAETSKGNRTTGPGATTYPGQDPTRGTSATYPGATRGTMAVYPGSQGTPAAYPGSAKGSMTAYPGTSSDEYVPEGSGSVIIRPGS